MSSKAKEEKSPSGFNLASTSSSFSLKSKDIFGSLEVLAQKHSAFEEKQESSESLERAGVIKHDPVIEDKEEDGGRPDRKRNSDSFPYRPRNNYSNNNRDRDRPHRSWNSDRRDNRRFPKEDFRRPRQAPPRLRNAPDYKKHPEKWTSYSLDDISERDMSERSNTNAALDFLSERKNERERQERLAIGLPAEEEKFESDTAACSKGIISFSRKKTKEKKMETDDAFDSNHTGHQSVEEKFTESFIENEEGGNLDESQLNKKKSELTKLNPDEVGGGEQSRDESVIPTFKSRKNVRKQIRKKGQDEGTEDKDR